MPFDLFLTVGLVILGFSIPSVVSAYRDGHAPRVAAIMVLIGGGLAAGAVTQKPGGYELADVPQAFTRVVGHYMPK